MEEKGQDRKERKEEAWFTGDELLVERMENMPGHFLGPKSETTAAQLLTSDTKAYSLRPRTMMQQLVLGLVRDLQSRYVTRLQAMKPLDKCNQRQMWCLDFMVGQGYLEEYWEFDHNEVVIHSNRGYLK